MISTSQQKAAKHYEKENVSMLVKRADCQFY